MSQAVTFENKSTADRFREDYSEYICPVDDDARTRTVHFVSDTPQQVIDEAEAAAESEKARAKATVEQIPLNDAERRALDFSRDGVNVPKARYLKGLGEQYNVDPFQHVDLAEIDSVHDARPILERARQTGGTNRGGGTAQYDDEATERRRRQRRENAEKHVSEGCDHARDFCENGDPEACEFLQTECGYAPDEVEVILGMVDQRDRTEEQTDQQRLVTVGGRGDMPEMDVAPEVAGALSRSWQGYKGAIARLDRELSDVREAVMNARQAIQAINSIRADNRQDDLHPDQLHELLAALESMPESIPEVRTLDHFGDSGDPEPVDPGKVIETDDQQTLGGGRADPQARLAGGEQGERGQGEVVEQTEENPGGLMADEREAVGETNPEEDTEQQRPDAFQVAEGGQETL